MMTPTPSIPVTIITGFLGSGKTHFLSRLLKDKNFENSAVIINEFGFVGLDHLLVETTNDQIFELPNGCLCCSARGALIDQMLDLADQRNKNNIQFDRLIIETSGVADANNLSQKLWHEPQITSQFFLANIVTIVSALEENVLQTQNHEISSQLAISDLILISKAELLLPAKRDEILARVIASVQLISSSTRIFALPPTPEIFAKILSFSPDKISGNQTIPELTHTTSKFATLTLTIDTPIKTSDIDNFLDLVISEHGADMLRIKGFGLIEGNEKQPMVVQSVKTTISPHYYLEYWRVQPRTTVTLIFNGNLARSITDIFQAAFNIPAIDQADNLALSNSPLSIPGIGEFKF